MGWIQVCFWARVSSPYCHCCSVLSSCVPVVTAAEPGQVKRLTSYTGPASRHRSPPSQPPTPAPPSLCVEHDRARQGLGRSPLPCCQPPRAVVTLPPSPTAPSLSLSLSCERKARVWVSGGERTKEKNERRRNAEKGSGVLGNSV